MTRLDQFRAKIWLMTAISLFFPLFGFAQQNAPVQSRITQAVDENQLTVLRGNTHPLARPEFDRGAAPPDLPMDRMLLVLKRSPAQETALLQLLGMQQDKSSSDYHKWLTPTQFGRQFGPSDDDIQTVTSWLQSHGFQIARVTNGRTAIEFSGSASQVKEAFHTEIHKYVVNGEEHWANSSDPQIPSALTPVVAGVATLHNFYKKPQLVRSNQRFTATLTPGGKPQFTNGANGMHALVPADYETIYNIPNPATGGSIVGTGITIAIVGRSNINLQDVQSFRQDFLPLAFAATSPRIQLDGSDPTDLGGGEEAEAVLDTTWSGAIAPGANVVLVVSQSTESTDGIDLSELYIVDNNLGDVMSESFGTCEAAITSAEATQISSLAEQAAAQGITYMVSSGDSGAEGCDPNSATVASGPISVNALASTQFTVAVGGTMFNEGATPTKFWSATNKPLPNGGSALSYVPEDVWNESCTGGGTSPCGPDITQPNILAGGGGKSGTRGAVFQVAKPVWQIGVSGILADGVRDLPDVSLTAAGHDPYLFCIDGSCTPNGQGEFQLFAVFGTSASSPSFAGIMALVDQKMGGRQGQANYVLYALARGETLSQCNGSSQSGLPASSCIFHDVTAGNNAVPGEVGFGTSGASYKSTTGYDLASGLGSPNVGNLLTKWSTARSRASAVTLTINPTSGITHGSPVSVNVTVAPASGTGTPTGDIALIASTGSSGTPQTIQSFTLSNGSISSATNLLPGSGNPPIASTVKAHYEGDGTFLGGDSSGVSVTVAPEASKTQSAIVEFNQNGQVINQNATSAAYGSPYVLRVNVTSASGDTCAQNSQEKSGCPTGIVSVTDNNFALDDGNFALNSLGYFEDQLIQLPAGTHNIVANYAGDNSFNASNATDSITITQAQTATALTSSTTNTIPGTSVTLTATISASSTGVAPSGNVTFLSGSTQLGVVPAAAATSSQPGIAESTAVFTTTQLPKGQDNITAQYTGDTNYSNSTSSVVTVNVSTTPDFVVQGNPTTINIGSPGTSGSTNLTFTGVNSFSGTIKLSASSCSGLPAGSTCSFSPSSVALSSTTTSATATLTVTTSAPAVTAPVDFANPKGIGWLAAIAGSGIMLLFLLIPAGKRRRWEAVFALLAFAAALGIAGCGGGGSAPKNPGTPTGTSNVVLTFTSGTTTHTLNLTVNVQ